MAYINSSTDSYVKEVVQQKKEEAFQQLKEGFNEMQIFALSKGFKEPQVLDPEFGEHTLIGVAALIQKNKAKTTQQALGMIQGLNHNETHAVVFQNLSKSEVKNIKAHTVVAIDTLQGLGMPSAEAFDEVKGLDAPETTKAVAKVSSSLTSQVSTDLDAKKHSTTKTIAFLQGLLAQPQTPDTAKGESLRKNNRETARNKYKSKKPRRKQ